MLNFDELSIISRIEELKKSRNWSTYMLAAQSGISYSALNQILRKPHIPTIWTLNKICNAFEISLSEFFSYCNPSQQEDVLKLWNSLDKQAKKYVIIYMKGLARLPIEEDNDEKL